MTAKIIDAIFPGHGPWAIPLLADVESLDNAGNSEFALLRCKFVDGKTLFVPIANQAVGFLIDYLSVHQLKLAEAEAKNQEKH